MDIKTKDSLHELSGFMNKTLISQWQLAACGYKLGLVGNYTTCLAFFQIKCSYVQASSFCWRFRSKAESAETTVHCIGAILLDHF